MHDTILERPNPGRQVASSARSWDTSSTVPSKSVEGILERLDRLDVEVVGRLVEDEQVGVPDIISASATLARSPPESVPPDAAPRRR